MKNDYNKKINDFRTAFIVGVFMIVVAIAMTITSFLAGGYVISILGLISVGVAIGETAAAYKMLQTMK